MALDGNALGKEDTSISFPEWADALSQLGVSGVVRQRFRFEIAAFLRECRLQHAPASVAMARQHLATVPALRRTGARSALRWFATRGRVLQTAGVAAAVERPARVSHAEPPGPAAQDLGGAD